MKTAVYKLEVVDTPPISHLVWRRTVEFWLAILSSWAFLIID